MSRTASEPSRLQARGLRVAMRDGAIVAQGQPRDVLDEELVRTVFDVHARVMPDPDTGAPLVLPRAALRR